jgi:hypothetical protein
MMEANMAARNHAPPSRRMGLSRMPSRADRRDRSAEPLTPVIDIDALFEDTMRRFPETMARLAE